MRIGKIAAWAVSLALGNSACLAQAASVWAGDAAGNVYRVDASSRQVLLTKSGVSPKDMSASADGSLWALGQGHLRKYSPAGDNTVDVSLATDDLVGAKILASNRYSGNLWVADVNAGTGIKQVVQVDGQAVRQSAFTSPGNTHSIYVELNGNLWVLGAGQVVHFATSGAQMAVINPGAAFAVAPALMTIDPVRNLVWLAGGTQIAAYDALSPGAPLHTASMPQAVVGMDVDAATGELWVAHSAGVVVLRPDGTERLALTDSSLASPSPQTIAFDSSTGAWLGYAGGIAILDAGGSVAGRVSLNQAVEWLSAPAFIPTPSVALTAPANGAVLAAPATFTLTANAMENGPAIAKVEFFQGTQSLGAVTSPPYQVSLSGLASGSYSFTAVATDIYGTSATSASLGLISDAAPSVAITLPSSGAVIAAPGNISVTANASDSDGSVAQIEFYSGSALIGTLLDAPYALQLSGLPAGTYTLTAKATDNLGIVSTSSPVTLIVDAPPTIALNSASAGAVVASPGSVALEAVASDSDGVVARVDFYRGGVLAASATSAPFVASIGGLPSGTYSFTAVATDDLGMSTMSASIAVRVDDAPTVSITGPAAGSTFPSPGALALTVSATDTDGTVSKVEFFNHEMSLGAATAAPFTLALSNLPTGRYSVIAVATDDAGLSATSQPVAFVVDNAPTVSLATSGTLKAPAAITLTANASDGDGAVAKVDFYQGDALLATLTSPPFAYVWAGVAEGTYSVRARATDDLGVATDSIPLTITVAAAGPQIYYVHTDQIGAPRMITRASDNQVVWEWDNTDAFGNNVPNENPTGQGAFAYNLRFPGQYYDQETGKDYNYFRDYDPSLGRYVESDPIGLLGGTNTYGYVYGDPLGLSDPYGLFGWADMPLVPQGVVDGVAGFGDGMSLGLTRAYRWWRDIDTVDTCSTTYQAGNWVAFAIGAGRMVYAARAAWGAAEASSGPAASAFREGLKRAAGGGGAYRKFNPDRYANAADYDVALRLGAGRTNKAFNALGAGAMGAGASGGSGCGCGGQ